jgi:hypothetical protein
MTVIAACVDRDGNIWMGSDCVSIHRNCDIQIDSAAMLTALKLNPDMHARMVVQLGLEAAAELDINIRPPFEIMCSVEVAMMEAIAV